MPSDLKTTSPSVSLLKHHFVIFPYQIEIVCDLVRKNR